MAPSSGWIRCWPRWVHPQYAAPVCPKQGSAVAESDWHFLVFEQWSKEDHHAVLNEVLKFKNKSKKNTLDLEDVMVTSLMHQWNVNSDATVDPLTPLALLDQYPITIDPQPAISKSPEWRHNRPAHSRTGLYCPPQWYNSKLSMWPCSYMTVWPHTRSAFLLTTYFTTAQLWFSVNISVYNTQADSSTSTPGSH